MKIAIGFGCPRSGTTFLHHCLQALEPKVLVVKLTEGRALHPAQSRDGLLELARLLKDHRLLLARSVRHPLDVVESFLAARKGPLRQKMLGIARNDDGEVAHWIREESRSVLVQRPLLAEQKHCTFLQVRDREMATAKGRDRIAQQVGKSLKADAAALARFRARLDEYGTKPVRPGRLMAGLGRVSTDEERAYFETRLAAIVAREGYK